MIFTLVCSKCGKETEIDSSSFKCGYCGHCEEASPKTRMFMDVFNKMEELKNEKRGDRKRSRRVQKENG